MATGAGLAEWKQTHGKKKAKCVLTSTGLLMEGVIAPSTRQEKSGHPGGVYWIRVRHPLLHLLFYKVVENNVAGNCVDGLDLPPLTEDHKIQVRIRGRDESTRAVRIYGVGARNIHWRD